MVGSYPQPDWLIDLEKLTHLPAVRVRASGTVVVPHITGPIRRLRPVEVCDVEFLRVNTFASACAGPRHKMAAGSSSQKGKKTVNPLLQRISIDPRVCGGKPCIKGTRIWVSLILDFLAEGMTEAELLAEFPQLTHEDVLAAIAFGAETARVRFVPVTAA